jgi:hypothetical protein
MGSTVVLKLEVMTKGIVALLDKNGEMSAEILN